MFHVEHPSRGLMPILKNIDRKNSPLRVFHVEHSAVPKWALYQRGRFSGIPFLLGNRSGQMASSLLTINPASPIR